MTDSQKAAKTAYDMKYRKERFKVISFDVPKEMDAAFRLKAKERGELISRVLKRCIEEYIK